MFPLLLLAAAVTTNDPAAAAPADRPYRVDHRLTVTNCECLDRTVWHSPPDSLHLNAAAHAAYFRFPDRPVQGGAKYRLRFSYLTARGSVGECQVRVTQYADTTTSWRVLDKGTIEQPLTVVGRWENVIIDVRMQPEATTAAIVFSMLSPCDVGEAWIDDVSLCEAGMPIVVGP